MAEPSQSTLSSDPTLQHELLRCHYEIASIQSLIRDGHADIQGLLLALADWSAELQCLINLKPDDR